MIVDAGGAYMAKMGRPKSDEAKEKVITMRVTSATYKKIKEYAQKHNLPYINFYELLDETGIDYETDTYDGGLHMNLDGARKLSKYLGNVLVSEYGIEDHRNDTAISAVYKEKYQFYEDMIQAQKQELKEYGEIRSY